MTHQDSPQSVTLSVPGLARIDYIPAKCRKIRDGIVRHDVSVRLPLLTTNDAPLSFTFFSDEAGKEETLCNQRRFYAGQNYRPLVVGTGDETQHLSLAAVQDQLANDALRCRKLFFSTGAPAFHDNPYKFPLLSEAWDDLGRVVNDTAIAENHTKAQSCPLVVIGGYLYEPGGEPYYKVQTFGLGNNHGGTALFVECDTARTLPFETHSWPANALDEAIAYAQHVANNRGDTESLPIVPHGSITVHRPDAVTRHNPAHGHGLATADMEPVDFMTALERYAGQNDRDTRDILLGFIENEGLTERLKAHLVAILDDEYAARLAG